MKAEIDEINEQLNIHWLRKWCLYEIDRKFLTWVRNFMPLKKWIMKPKSKNINSLGFAREDFTRQTSEFSGGWRMNWIG
jgi:ATP-binding cassette subfamily F protein 3